MINTLTLNPAIDKILYINKFEENVTNRVQKTNETIGGKGTHVSINLKILGLTSRAFGIAHGNTGQQIINILEHYGIDVRFIHHEYSKSRTNYLLVDDSHNCTIIAEKGVQLSEVDIEDIINKMKDEILLGDYIVLSGDASNFYDPTVYNRILISLRDKGLKVFLDTSGSTLLKCIEDTPFLIKPNLDELSMLCGHHIACNDSDVISAIDSLSPYNIEIIAVSLGKYGAIIKSPDGIYKAVPPLVHVVNTVGCGDSFLAGLLYGFYNNLTTLQTIKLATAISAATAESPLSVGFEYNRAMELIEQSQIIKIR